MEMLDVVDQANGVGTHGKGSVEFHQLGPGCGIVCLPMPATVTFPDVANIEGCNSGPGGAWCELGGELYIQPGQVSAFTFSISNYTGPTITATASNPWLYPEATPANNTVTAQVEPMTPACTFSGFFAPIDNKPTVNRAKAGSNVPIKFAYCTDGRLDILATGSPATTVHQCGTSTIDDIEETLPDSAGTLTFNPSSLRYQYNWKTNKAWIGQCRTLRLTFKNGTTQEAEFRFT